MSAAMEYPQRQQQQQQRPRSKSTFSFKSDHSHGSNKHDKSHSSPEKLHHRGPSKDDTHLHTKADPNAAMNEVQPIAAALEKPTLQSLRSFQHTDLSGQVIAEPDLSNPTRSRWERPLDTIRSFEAAIDNEYRRRAQTMRADVSDMGGFSRRSSYYGGGGGYEQNRFSQAGGQYGSRQAAAARDSWMDNGYGPVGGQRQRYNRMQSDPSFTRYSNGPGGVYPPNGYQQSRDTINTNGSNGSESAPYSNDPSENSSIERGGPVRYPDGDQYGVNSYSGGPPPVLEEYGHRTGPLNNGPYQNGGSMPPPVPMKAQPPPNNPNMIKLNSTGQESTSANGGRPNVLSRKSTDVSDKRRSWFKKRFSKN